MGKRDWVALRIGYRTEDIFNMDGDLYYCMPKRPAFKGSAPITFGSWLCGDFLGVSTNFKVTSKAANDGAFSELHIFKWTTLLTTLLIININGGIVGCH
ncbi:unnamed protein product [Brassica rapa subsp. narinosa]